MIGGHLLRRLGADLRHAFNPGDAKPAYAAGVRAAVATVVPLVADMLLHTGGAAWMSLAGLNGALIDRGGPYRMRAAVMGMVALASAVAVLAGGAAASHPALALLLTFVLAVACGLTRAWTDVGPGFGVTVLVTYVVALAVPASSLHAALVRAGFILTGGGWAMAIALMFWPLRPYRPVRLRVSAAFRAIAEYAMEASAALVADPAHDPMRFHQQRLQIRAALESARSALAVSRRGRGSETGRGERLLVLEELADQLFVHLMVLLEETHLRAQTSTTTDVHTAVAELLRQIADTLDRIALAIEAEKDEPPVQVQWSGRALHDARDIADIVDRMADYAGNAALTAGALNGGAPVGVPAPLGGIEPPDRPLFSIDALTHPDSIVLRHALRVAAVTTVAVGIAQLLHLNHGYWVTLTVIVILQPYGAATRQKALQRVLGTMVGGIVAAGLSALFHSAIAVFILIAAFTMLCVALLPVNYGAYAVFGTPAFVLLAEAGAGDWHLAGTRIINTLIGGALALLGMRLLWPTPEWRHLPQMVAQALATEAEYLADAWRALAGAEIPAAALGERRRRLAHDALNAEESLQRLIQEHRGPASALEPIMAVMTYLRRAATTIGSLALMRPAMEPSAADHVRNVAALCRGVLLDLAQAAAESRRPAPLPTLRAPDATSTVPPLVRDRLTRLVRQVRVLHDAVERWTTQLPS